MVLRSPACYSFELNVGEVQVICLRSAVSSIRVIMGPRPLSGLRTSIEPRDSERA
jgi:hypothetical protein